MFPLDRLGAGDRALTGSVVGKLDEYEDELNCDFWAERYGDVEEEAPSELMLLVGP